MCGPPDPYMHEKSKRHKSARKPRRREYKIMRVHKEKAATQKESAAAGESCNLQT